MIASYCSSLGIGGKTENIKSLEDKALDFIATLFVPSTLLVNFLVS